MNEHTIGLTSVQTQEEMMNMALPLQNAWRKLCFDLPFVVLSEGLRFAGHRLQAQSEFVASLGSCRTVPEVMEVQSQFVRRAVDEYGSETSRIMDDVRSTMSRAA